jgi:hypothetical protein
MDVLISRPFLDESGKKISRTVEISPAAADPPQAAVVAEFLTLDLAKLTGADVDFCVAEAGRATGQSVKVLVTDLEFHMQMAAKALGVDRDLLKKLPSNDYVEVATNVQAFLTGSVSP